LAAIARKLEARIRARGYTLYHLESAASRNDDNAIRTILGMTDAEMAAVLEEIRQLREGRAPERGGQPRGSRGGRTPPWMDDPHVDIRDAHCSWVAYTICIGIAATSSLNPNIAQAIADYLFKSFLCMCSFCEGGINDYICPALHSTR
jgi:hypothetical protein